MPLAPDYISSAELKAAIGQTTNLADDDIARAITAASRAIDKATGRKFGKTDAPEARRYTATSRGFVVIHDAVTIDSVSVNGSVLDTSTYDAAPLNAALDEEPYLWIDSDNAFSLTRAGVTVTAVFGWPEIPTQVEQIVLIVASKLVKRSREAPFGIVSSGGLDGLALRITREDPDAQLLLGPLMRAETVGNG